MTLALSIHFLFALIWVGGMFFAHFVVRPATLALELEPRVLLWHEILKHFIFWVWLAVIVLPLSGYWMVFVEFGGINGIGLHIYVMQGLGLIMIGLFLFMFFSPYRQMRRMVQRLLLPEAGLYFNRIRLIVNTNLVLGLITAMVGAVGRYW